VRYYPLIYQGARLSFSSSGKTAEFKHAIVGPRHLDPRHAHEWTIAYFVKFIRTRVHPSWMPHGTFFANGAPDNLDELHEIFGDKLIFNAKSTGFEFYSALFDTPITESNPVLLRIISHHADDLIHELGKMHPFRAQVRLLIMAGLEHNQAKAGIVAKMLNISLTTFRRRLREDGLEFRELRDGIIKDLSERALIETSLPLGDIALKMGYSELSAFSRAFTRFSGMSPIAYRRSARQQ